jgi:hypothetical protein
MLIHFIINIYIVGIFITYEFIEDWNKTKFEKIWFSIVWPILVPLYIIHWLYNKF